jgi:hypothetical protein
MVAFTAIVIGSCYAQDIKILEVPVNDLPASVKEYVKEHKNGATIKEASRITDANGKISYEAEVKGRDLIFDESGKFIKAS